MKNNIYLHIGLPKTGTTTIQIGLKNNEEIFKNHGYFCPKTGCVRNKLIANHNLSWEIANSRRFSADQGTWSDLFDEINNETKPRNVIISSECFSVLPEEKIEIIYSLLASNYNIIIICYIRRQDKYLQSMWSQIITHRQEMSNFSDWLKTHNYSYKYTDYFEFISKWTGIFGKKNIRLRVLEKEQLINGNLFLDFLNACDIDNYNDFQIPINANVSPGLKTLILLEEIKRDFAENLHLEIQKCVKNLIIKYSKFMGWNKEKLNLIDKKLYSIIMNRYENSNIKTAKLYFNRQKLFFEPFKEQEISTWKTNDFSRFEIYNLIIFCLKTSFKIRFLRNIFQPTKDDKSNRITEYYSTRKLKHFPATITRNILIYLCKLSRRFSSK